MEEIKNDYIFEIERLECEITSLQSTIRNMYHELDSNKVDICKLEAQVADLEINDILLKNKISFLKNKVNIANERFNLKQQECDELRYEINCFEDKNQSLRESLVEETTVMQTLINKLIE